MPDDLAIAAINDSPVLRASSPAVTALDLHPEQLGSRAVERLVALLEGTTVENVSEPVPVDLVRRASTAVSRRAGDDLAPAPAPAGASATR